MIACPSCKRRIFTRRDMWYASLEGLTQCRACGRIARLDVFSRWMISCVLALLLPAALFWGEAFYSGHLLLMSMIIVLGGWRILSSVGFAVLTLEAEPRRSSIDRRQSILLLVVLLVAAIIMDSFMASRFEVDNALENGRSPRAVAVDR